MENGIVLFYPIMHASVSTVAVGRLTLMHQASGIIHVQRILRRSCSQRYYLLQPITYQLVLISDASRWTTFALFLYKKTEWRVWRRARMGHYFVCAGTKDESMSLAQSGRSSAFSLANTVGNTGMCVLRLVNCVFKTAQII